tara:strand:+ start:104 stop:1165 length:1062 start_codon:yes stop_codon:yes gene_type:complete
MAKYKFLPTGLPKISKYARDRERPSSKYFRLVEKARKVCVEDLILSENDPRNEDMDWTHVDNIYNNLLEAGCDEDGQLPAVVPTADNQYDVIDNHHLIAALRKAKQVEWYVDVYDYTGIDPKFMWSAATNFGFSINNSHNPTKRTTTSAVINAALRIKESVGYLVEPNIPLVDQIEIWLRETKQHEVFAKTGLGMIKNGILNPSKFAGKKIRNLSTKEVRNVVFSYSKNYYGSGVLTGGRYGFVVCTDNATADAPKWWNQVVNALDEGYKPVVQTYSKEDDPTKIIKNDRNGWKRLYEQFEKASRIMSTFYPNVTLEPISEEEFISKLEYVAMGQIDGEYTVGENDFINRPLF